MLITKKSDYAMRIFRVLKDQEIHNVGEIVRKETIPKAFAYKILHELEKEGLVKSHRGNRGGYVLNRSLETLTLYNIVLITEGDLFILHCMNENCERNIALNSCGVHEEVVRIQDILIDELKKKKISELV